MSGKTEINYISKRGINLTYMEDPYPVQNFIGTQKLLVIFQSLGDENSEDNNQRYPYTLIDGLKFLNCRKIYIKDDIGLAGTYYLGTKGSTGVKVAVLEFLKSKICEYGIKKKELTMIGFSKGGYASLMFGFELGAKTIISAVPQFDLTSWIYKYKPFLSYILPDNPSDTDKELYKNYLKNVILKSNYKPEVFLITSLNDNTYEDHIPALIDTLTEKNIPLKVYYNNEECVTRHNNVVVNSMNEIFAILSMAICDEVIKKFYN